MNAGVPLRHRAALGIALVLAIAWLGLASAQVANAASQPALLHLKALSTSRLGTTSGPMRPDLVRGTTRRLALSLARDAWGGVYTTRTREHVNVYASSSYDVDSAFLQSAADFVGDLVHGPEISTVTIYFAPLDEVEQTCGSGSLGCYLPSTQDLTVIGNDTPDGYTVENVLTHEFGHHIANNRSNDPWVAGEWGTKGWASYEDVCNKQAAGAAFPGDEGAHYLQNPGEAFAESYMYLNAQSQGRAVPPWQYDPMFMPDYAALSAISSDVLTPWRGPRNLVWRGRVSRGHTVSSTLPTKLDGNLNMRLSAPRGSVLQIFAGGRLVRSTRTGLSLTVCGARSITTRLRGGATGRFTVTASAP